MTELAVISSLSGWPVWQDQRRAFLPLLSELQASDVRCLPHTVDRKLSEAATSSFRNCVLTVQGTGNPASGNGAAASTSPTETENHGLQSLALSGVELSGNESHLEADCFATTCSNELSCMSAAKLHPAKRAHIGFQQRAQLLVERQVVQTQELVHKVDKLVRLCNTLLIWCLYHLPADTGAI